MRHLHIYAAAVILLVAGCTPKGEYSHEVLEALRELDRTIAAKETYEKQKETHILDIKSKMTSISSPESHYEILDRLYQEFYQYNIDSAIFYANTKLNLARTGAMANYANDAVLDLADRYVMSGMYAEVIGILEEIDYGSLDWPEIPRYLHIYHALYDGMEKVCDDPLLRKKYMSLKHEYRDRLYERLGDDDIAKLFVHSEMLYDYGMPEEALDELLERYGSEDSDIHIMAVLSYSIARAYRRCSDNEKAMLWYVQSAINDIKTPVHEYMSLHELAALLYEAGDIKRAYRYITISVNDAIAANARINIQSINEFLPIISDSYNRQMKFGRQNLQIALSGISILFLLLVAASIIMVTDRKRIAFAEQETRKANGELQKLNIQLEKYIDRLQEASDIKETYLGRYIDLCSDYIGRLDRYRMQLGRIAKTSGLDELRKELKSTSFIEEELSEFYAQFDATFLHLFPDFVEQLNELMQPDKRIRLKSSDSAILTTELRILALIRLGVHDSVKIAGFLRRSVSTVYNYRVKMRNAALNNREDFEKQIMKIGIQERRK
ncbi:MAG: hypothetical protein K2O58_11000 [Bacteroidales bacterium]|nr:hypothetical protein [Bacteroidales bacterium]